MTDLSEEFFPEKYDRNRILHLYSESAAGEMETIEFWKRSIRNYCFMKGKLEFNISEVSQAFIVDEIIPSSLEICTKKLIQQNYLQSPLSITRSIWINYALSWMDRFYPSSDNSTFVSVEVLDEITSACIEYIQLSGENELYVLEGYESIADSSTFYSFLKRVGSKSSSSSSQPSVGSASLQSIFNKLTTKDVSIIANYLVKKQAGNISEDRKYIKLSKILGSSSKSSKLISDFDIAKAQLKHTISKLEKRIETLETKANEHQEKAIAFHRKHDKNITLFHLKLKKLTMESREKASNALLTLITASYSIEESNYNVVIADAYAASVKIMNSLREDSKYSVDSITDVLNELEDEMENIKDVDKVIMNGISQNQLLPDEEKALEDELNSLVSNMSIHEISSTDITNTTATTMIPSVSSLNLPLPPSHTPTLSQDKSATTIPISSASRSAT